MNQEKETNFIENLIIIVVLAIIFSGVFGGLKYQFFPRQTIESAFLNYCQKLGGEIFLAPIPDSDDGACTADGVKSKCFSFYCVKNKK